MSLLTSGPDDVEVFTMSRVRNRAGGWEKVRNPGVWVRGGYMRPVSSTELNGLGTTVETLYQFYHPGPWPGGNASVVVWRGVEYDQQGEAQEYRRSPTIQHVVVTLRARTVEVK